MSLEDQLRDLEALVQREGAPPSARGRSAAASDSEPLSPASEADGAAAGHSHTVSTVDREEGSTRRGAGGQALAGAEPEAAAADGEAASAYRRLKAQAQAEQRASAALCAGLRRRAARIRALRDRLQEAGVEVPEAAEDAPALTEGEGEEETDAEGRGQHGAQLSRGAGSGDAGTSARRLLAAASSTQRYPLDSGAADAAVAALGGDAEPACAALLEAGARFDALRRENALLRQAITELQREVRRCSGARHAPPSTLSPSSSVGLGAEAGRVVPVSPRTRRPASGPGSGQSRIRAAVRAREGVPSAEQAVTGTGAGGRRRQGPQWARDTRASASRRSAEGSGGSRPAPQARGPTGSVVVRRMRGAVDTVATESEGEEEAECGPGTLSTSSSRRPRQGRAADGTQRSLDTQLRAVVRAGRFRRRRYPGPDPVPLPKATGAGRTEPQRRLRTRSHSPPPTAAPAEKGGEAGEEASDRNGFKFELKVGATARGSESDEEGYYRGDVEPEADEVDPYVAVQARGLDAAHSPPRAERSLPWGQGVIRGPRAPNSGQQELARKKSVYAAVRALSGPGAGPASWHASPVATTPAGSATVPSPESEVRTESAGATTMAGDKVQASLRGGQRRGPARRPSVAALKAFSRLVLKESRRGAEEEGGAGPYAPAEEAVWGPGFTPLPNSSARVFERRTSFAVAAGRSPSAGEGAAATGSRTSAGSEDGAAGAAGQRGEQGPSSAQQATVWHVSPEQRGWAAGLRADAPQAASAPAAGPSPAARRWRRASLAAKAAARFGNGNGASVSGSPAPRLFAAPEPAGE